MASPGWPVFWRGLHATAQRSTGSDPGCGGTGPKVTVLTTGSSPTSPTCLTRSEPDSRSMTRLRHPFEKLALGDGERLFFECRPGVLGQARPSHLTGEIRSCGVMASLTQLGRYQLPVPAGIPGAVDEDECSHPAPSAAST